MKKLIILMTVLVLSGCASIIDRQGQNITMKTPGAENARCLIENQDMKYVAYTDQTLEIKKSSSDLVIRCQAPGNRERTVHVKRGLSEWVFVNVVNGFVLGAAYDVASKAAFTYPDEFVVSFVGVPSKPYPLPDYQNPDLRNYNNAVKMEYMGPGEKLSERNKGDTPYVLQKKENLYGVSDLGETSVSTQPNLNRQYNSRAYDPTEEDK